MGRHEHVLMPEDDGGSPTCVCGCEAVIRQGKYRCPISWHNNHGMGRKEHRQSATGGLVECRCGASCSQLPNGMWTCRNTRERALKGIARQERIVGIDEIEAARELGSIAPYLLDREMTDAEVFDELPVPKRSYPSYKKIAKRVGAHGS